MTLAYHVGAILEAMQREGRSTTAEALLDLWRQSLVGMGRDPSISLRVVDEHEHQTITDQIRDFASAVVLEGEPPIEVVAAPDPSALALARAFAIAL